jgi:hypothetical protein
MDYQTLVNLSNVSRIEAINTFGQLSTRLSHSQLALSSEEAKFKRKRGAQEKGSSSSLKKERQRSTHSRSKSAPDLSITMTALGPTSSKGWVRPKPRRNASSTSTKSQSSALASPKKSLQPQHRSESAGIPITSHRHRNPRSTPVLDAEQVSRHSHRHSIMSFASDSTKLGEIPERHWSKPNLPTPTAFPLTPFREPHKPRSRFMRLFSRGT